MLSVECGVVSLASSFNIQHSTFNIEHSSSPLGTPVAASVSVTRRLLALLGFLAVVALAATLLYRVYVHHIQAEPYGDESSLVVLDSKNYNGLALSDSPGVI
jgi:hypothetical protein